MAHWRNHDTIGGVVQLWTNATQAADPTPAGYSEADETTGATTLTRALTAAETVRLAQIDAANVPTNNLATLQQRLDTGLAQMQTWMTNNPNGATLNAAQTLALVKMVNTLTKITRGALNDITGT